MHANMKRRAWVEQGYAPWSAHGTLLVEHVKSSILPQV
jgi:hypothetical protein